MANSSVLVVIALALLVAYAAATSPSCYKDRFQPEAVMTWGIEGYQDASPVVSNLDGWHLSNGITGETLEQTRHEALQWYAERYGFNNTVLSYDPTTGFATLPQGSMVPTFLTAAGFYHLWAESDSDVVEQKCPNISVVEWVFFTNPSIAGTVYNGTYGAWYKLRDPNGAKVSVNDVVSIGRYVIRGTKKGGDKLVLNFKTWFPVRLDAEHTYRVDNIIKHPELGWGLGQSNYRFYLAAGTTSTWWVQNRNTIKFPFIEPPPIDPSN